MGDFTDFMCRAMDQAKSPQLSPFEGQVRQLRISLKQLEALGEGLIHQAPSFRVVALGKQLDQM